MHYLNPLSQPEEFSKFVTEKLAESPSKYAFVVNIPIQANEGTFETIRKVCDAYYLKGMSSPPFAIVFCVNSSNDINKFFEEHGEKIQQLLAAETRIPICLTPYRWTGSEFPYGEVRNVIMRHEMTEEFAKRFRELGLITYISTGDADTGRRTTLDPLSGQEEHVFQSMARALTVDNTEANNFFKDIGMSTPLEDTINFSPYVMSGGYRVSESTSNSAEKISPQELALRKKAIEDDMRVRQDLSILVNPLGSYSPEPNFSFDSRLLTAMPNVQFGPKGAEYSHFRDTFSQGIKGLHEEVDLLTNRHNERGALVVNGFTKLSVETDTERLFKGTTPSKAPEPYIPAPNIVKAKQQLPKRYNYEQVKQHHGATNMAKSAFLKNRYVKNIQTKDSKKVIRPNGGNSYIKLLSIVEEILEAKNLKNGAMLLVEFEQLIYALQNKRSLDEVKMLVSPDLIKHFSVLMEIYKLSEDMATNRTADAFISPDHTLIAMWNTLLVSKVYIVQPELKAAMQEARREFLPEKGQEYDPKIERKPLSPQQRRGELFHKLFVGDGRDAKGFRNLDEHLDTLRKAQKELMKKAKKWHLLEDSIRRLAEIYFTADQRDFIRYVLSSKTKDEGSEQHRYDGINLACQELFQKVKQDLFSEAVLANFSVDEMETADEMVREGFEDFVCPSARQVKMLTIAEYNEILSERKRTFDAVDDDVHKKDVDEQESVEQDVSRDKRPKL